jgi:hypothetical protein
VALQETVLREDHDQVRDLLGEEFHLVHGTCREPDGSGVSVASRCRSSGCTSSTSR